MLMITDCILFTIVQLQTTMTITDNSLTVWPDENI